MAHPRCSDVELLASSIRKHRQGLGVKADGGNMPMSLGDTLRSQVLARWKEH